MWVAEAFVAGPLECGLPKETAGSHLHSPSDGTAGWELNSVPHTW